MYIAYHDQDNKLHIVHDCEDKYFGTWGTYHQCSIYIKDNQVIEEYSDWSPEEPSDDTWDTGQEALGTVDFTGSSLEELVSQHKQWFKTFLEQAHE